MSYKITVQRVSKDKLIPTNITLKKWLTAALTPFVNEAEVTIRIVDEAESAELNGNFRQKSKPTNVLAFPFPDAEELGMSLLGDIVICASVVENEAQAQQKPVAAHFAHMVVHGALHLLGYDHIQEADANKMEREEIKILKTLGYPNPYEEDK